MLHLKADVIVHAPENLYICPVIAGRRMFLGGILDLCHCCRLHNTVFWLTSLSFSLFLRTGFNPLRENSAPSHAWWRRSQNVKKMNFGVPHIIQYFLNNLRNAFMLIMFWKAANGYCHLSPLRQLVRANKTLCNKNSTYSMSTVTGFI